jgi:hypothetical protein
MAISTSYAPLSYSGNGSTTAFSVTWQFVTGTLVVTAIAADGVETVKTITTHYTVAGGTDANGLPATGTVTMLTAPASGTQLRIERSTPLTQSAVYVNGDAFPAKSHEAALDRAVLRDQEIAYAASRSLQLSVADMVAGADPTLPTLTDNAGYALAVNDDEDGFDLVSLSGINLTVGTVTTGAAGTDAEATITGTAPDFELDLTIPRGNTGLSGNGTGDLISTNNLSDVANTATAFATIKQAASTSATGVVELATDAETQTGTDTARAITPANLQACTATETRKGVIELATDAEVQTGTDTARAVTPAGLQACTGTETRKGVLELATTAEVVNGSDTARAVTPAGVAAALAAFTAAMAADYQAFTGSGTWTKPSGFGSEARAFIQVWGAGGGGGRANASGNAGGGGGGAYVERWILLSSLGSTETVTIGAAGAGGASNDTNGTAGGNTTFGAWLTGYGGGGGGRAAADASAGSGGGGTWAAAGTTAGGGNATNSDAPSKGGIGASVTSSGGCCPVETNTAASNSHSGGGGGGGKNNATLIAAGTSVIGGSGGASGVAGTAPGGGGGGNVNAEAGAGAAGQCFVTVFDGA